MQHDILYQHLMKFIQMDETSSQYNMLALESAFAFLTDAYDMDFMTAGLEMVGPERFSNLVMAAEEFYCSNTYSETGQWNVVEHYLASKEGKKRSDEEKEFLLALRRSYMSIYEIARVNRSKGTVTVKDLIMQDHVPITFHDKEFAQIAKKGQTGGLRLIHLPDMVIMTPGIIHLQRETAKETAANIRFIHERLMAMLPSKCGDLTEEELEQSAKAMWATEIIEAWLMDNLDIDPEAKYKNSEGHDISPVVLVFPISGKEAETAVRTALQAHEAFEPDREHTQHWMWVDTERSRKEAYAVRAHLIFEEGELQVHANSRQRGNIIEALLNEIAGEHLGKAIWEDDDGLEDELLPLISSMAESLEFTDAGDEEDGLTIEDVASIILDYKQSYYQDWLNQPIPALGNKTPRAARKTKKGTQQLITLLEDLEVTEQMQAQAKGLPVYDTAWLWEELDLEKEHAA